MLIMASCGKETIEDHPEFVGDWYYTSGLTEIAISINSDGTGVYEKNTGFGYTIVSGKFKIKGGDKMKIGVKKLSIDNYPEVRADGTRAMMLDGDLYEEF